MKKTYAELTHEQLYELHAILTGCTIDDHYIITEGSDSTDPEIIVVNSEEREIAFSINTGNVMHMFKGITLQPVYNLFDFMRKCAEFGLTY